MMTEQQPSERQGSALAGSTVLAAILAFLFYPTTLAPLGSHTNGGALGLAALVIASALAWYALLFNRRDRWLWWCVQLPLAAFITCMAIAEALVQHRSGHWLWF